MNNYTPLHMHTMLSNATTVLDSVNSYQQYIEKAKEYGIKSMAFTEHGNLMSWYNKYLECKKNDIKYIHGCEVYVTKTINEKVRDNYHCILISRNTKGMHELNYLLSDKVAFNKQDGHFYYNPRITYDELKLTSNNIIILTACMGGILNSDDDEIRLDFEKYLSKNRDRCFLEIQPHRDKENKQSIYNQYLASLSQKYNIPLVATNDIHYLNSDYKKGRSLLQKRKKVHFGNEDDWDLEFKSYGEFVKSFKLQNSLDEKIYLKAINNTNKIADMIEDYSIDTSIKYPKLYKDSEQTFIRKIKEGIEWRNIDIKTYRDRINYEFDVMKKNGAIDYMLLEEDVKRWCRENDIKYGASRGSSSGSIIAFLLGITDVDSLKYNLNFERFMSRERVSLMDIDTDYEPSKRELVKEYLHTKKGLYCAEIITFNTIQKKGALKDVGGALGIDFNIMNEITKNIDEKENEYRTTYPELFKYADMLEGVITSIGNHPAATLVSPCPLESICSTFTNERCKYPITQINMKEVDKMNFLKLDILGLETIEIINDVCNMVGIDFLTPQNFNPEDENIYNEIYKSGVSIFQWESPTAWEYYKNLFSTKTLNKIKSKNKNFKYLDLLSVGNGAIRPAGASYRDDLSNGIYKDNGVEMINEYFKDTLNNCVYQEQIMGFLNKFCGFTMGEADIVRRGFSKKTGTEEFIPKIKDGFLKNSGLSEKDGEYAIDTFIKVVEDASDYLFSLNHSQVYSIIGAMTASLRHYHTLEFLTVCFEHAQNNQSKTDSLMKYMRDFTDVELKPVEFGKSESKYSCDKENNIIYKGMKSIKKINDKIPSELNKLYGIDNFPSLIDSIKKNTSTNSGQLEALIQVNYFKQFGSIKKCLTFLEYYVRLSKKTYKLDKIDKDLEKYFTMGFTSQVVKKEIRINKELWNGKDRIIKETKKRYTIERDVEVATYPLCEKTETMYKNINKEIVLNSIWNDLSDEEFDVIDLMRFSKEYLGYISDIPNDISLGKVEMVSVKNRSANIKSLRTNKSRWFRFKKDESSLPNKGETIIIENMYKKKGWKGRENWWIEKYEKL